MNYVYLLRLLILGATGIIFRVVWPIDGNKHIIHFLEMLSLPDDRIDYSADIGRFLHQVRVVQINVRKYDVRNPVQRRAYK